MPWMAARIAPAGFKDATSLATAFTIMVFRTHSMMEPKRVSFRSLTYSLMRSTMAMGPLVTTSFTKPATCSAFSMTASPLGPIILAMRAFMASQMRLRICNTRKMIPFKSKLCGSVMPAPPRVPNSQPDSPFIRCFLMLVTKLLTPPFTAAAN